MVLKFCESVSRAYTKDAVGPSTRKQITICGATIFVQMLAKQTGGRECAKYGGALVRWCGQSGRDGLWGGA